MVNINMYYLKLRLYINCDEVIYSLFVTEKKYFQILKLYV